MADSIIDDGSDATVDTADVAKLGDRVLRLDQLRIQSETPIGGKGRKRNQRRINSRRIGERL